MFDFLKRFGSRNKKIIETRKYLIRYSEKYSSIKKENYARLDIQPKNLKEYEKDAKEILELYKKQTRIKEFEVGFEASSIENSTYEKYLHEKIISSDKIVHECRSHWDKMNTERIIGNPRFKSIESYPIIMLNDKKNNTNIIFEYGQEIAFQGKISIVKGIIEELGNEKKSS